jgi:hypothetical protein
VESSEDGGISGVGSVAKRNHRRWTNTGVEIPTTAARPAHNCRSDRSPGGARSGIMRAWRRLFGRDERVGYYWHLRCCFW